MNEGINAAGANKKDPYAKFQKDLEHLINTHSLENFSDMPDFMLAEFVVGNLRSLAHIVRSKKMWSKEDDEPISTEFLNPK